MQIFDIGDNKGQPFFALEFVDGGSLQQKLDGTPLSARNAAELVGILARAVDYAHQRGIVHRDLKPANILLGEDKGDSRGGSSTVSGGARATAFGIPKITDFGLAKRTDEHSGQTGTGDILGTPSYMSPEQAVGKNDAVGPPADIYSLGAILYDLLTGRPPFKGETVLDTLQQVQGHEPLPPTRIQPKIPRDLETICLRCLEKDPVKRYTTAADLADDLQRFMEDKPILARPTPWWERVVKWSKRRPAVAALLATLAVVLTGSFIGMLVLWLQAEGERRVAEAQKLAADEAREDSDRQKTKAVEARGEAVAQRDRAEKNLFQAFDAGARMLSKVSEERLLKVPQMEGLRKELLLQAKGFFEAFYAIEGNTPVVRYQVALAHRNVGNILGQLGKHGDAPPSYQKSLTILADLANEAPDNRDYRHALADTHADFGVVLQALNQPMQAESQYREALHLLIDLQEKYPLEVGYARDLASTSNNLAVLLMADPARRQDAHQAHLKALGWMRKLHLDYPKDRHYQADLARELTSFGLQHLAAGQRPEAEKAFEESLRNWTDLTKQEPDSAAYQDASAVALTNLAVLWETHNPQKAEASYREVIALEEKLVQDYPRLADYRFNLALGCTNLSLLLAKDNKRGDEAAKWRGLAMRHWEKLTDQDQQMPDYQLRLIGCLQDEARYQLSHGKTQKAIDVTLDAIKRQQQMVADFPDRPEFQVKLARGYLDLGRIHAEKPLNPLEESSYRQALKILEELRTNTKSPSPEWARTTAEVHRNLGAMFASRTEMAEALPWLEKAVKYQREAIQQEPGNTGAQKDLAQYGLMAVQVHVELNDFAGASKAAADLEPTLSKLPGASGDELHILARLMARSLRLTSGDQQKHYRDQVAGLLQKAASQGFRNVNALRVPLFEPLRGLPAYDELLRDLDKK